MPRPPVIDTIVKPAQPEVHAKVDVAQLLTTSRQAHGAYRLASARRVNGLIMHDPERARAALERAAEYRALAHEHDPAHTSPAWALDDHDELTAFYLEQLSRP